MTVMLTAEKQTRLKIACENLLSMADNVSIRVVAETIGLLVSSFPGVQYGQLFYHSLEIDKIAALRKCAGNFDATMSISSRAREDLQWWIVNIATAYSPIDHGTPVITITSDASMLGWGAVRGDTTAGGRWSRDETELH